MGRAQGREAGGPRRAAQGGARRARAVNALLITHRTRRIKAGGRAAQEVAAKEALTVIAPRNSMALKNAQVCGLSTDHFVPGLRSGWVLLYRYRTRGCA